LAKTSRGSHTPAGARPGIEGWIAGFCWLLSLAGVFAVHGSPVPSVCALLFAVAATSILAATRVASSRRQVEDERDSAQRAGREATRRLAEAQASLLRVASELDERATELAETRRHFELALQGSNDGVWEYDLRTRRLYLSPDFRERLGLEPGEEHGELTWFETHLHPDDVERWKQTVAEHLEHRASYNLDLRLRTPSGEYRLFRARGSAEWDLNGKPVRMAGSLTDITERRLAESRLREREASFRSLSAASPIGILKADALGRCEYCNERWREIAGLDAPPAAGASWLDAVDGGDRERIDASWSECVLRTGRFDEQFRVRRPDGAERWVRARANAVRDDRGGVAGFVLTFEDVTHDRNAADELAVTRDRAMQAAQAKSEFLANMSHEIRTPLNGVIGMTELLAASPLNDEQRDYVRTINTSADALLTIINDILDFSKIEAGKLNIERVEFELRPLFEDVAEVLAARARERDLDLLVAVDPALPRRTVGDPTRIRQILLNLASNAIKFTDRGEVELGAEPVTGGLKHGVRLRVRDTGIGISPDRLGAVFDSFTQADGSTTRKYGGTGLGLTICRQLAELMGGSIHVSSEPGKGSTFWAELPLPPAPSSHAEPAGTTLLGGTRVLVVDDHELHRRILADTLSSWGAQAVAVASGAEAVARAGDSPAGAFQLVLMNHRPPGLDGLDAARRLRLRRGSEAPPVVILASAGPPAGQEIGDGGPVALWLTRPLREVALISAIGRVLGHPEAAPVPVPLPQASEDFSLLSLLLVDDNEVNRKVALRMLERLGARATAAANGAEALEKIASRRYDLVFMDCQMPQMDGFEATRAVRAREAEQGGHVRIVAMTANAMEGDRERCLDAGMDDYIAKPVKLQALAAQLRRALTDGLRPAA